MSVDHTELPSPAGNPTQGRWRSRSRWLRELLLVAAVYWAVRTYQQRDLASGVAPAIEGVTLTGEPTSLAQHRGKPLLLHFWATWCGVCRAEQSTIDAIASDQPVLSIASQSGAPEAVAAYVAEHHVAPPVVLDPTSKLARQYGVHAFPTTFVLDADGGIRFREVGYTTELGLRVRLWLASKL